MDNAIEEEQLKALNQHKQELMYELRAYEENLRKHKVGETSSALVPPDTHVDCALVVRRALYLSTCLSVCMCVCVSISNSVILYVAI